MQPFDSRQLTAILQDLLVSPVPAGVIVSAISTDTRTLVVGDTFVAISGERFDGHCFVETALANGASALLVERPQQAFVPQVVVRDTRLALGRLAAAIRDDFVQRGGIVIGVTGSAGKTTSKQMLAAIFSQQGKTHATKGNFNNELGVPFTWFALPDDAEFAVIEMGANHQGEIAYLSGISRPHIAMITNAGEAHLQGFGGVDGVAKGKGELFAGLCRGDTAVINMDDKYASYWRSLTADGVKVKTFALQQYQRQQHQADVYAEAIAADYSRFVLCADGQRQALVLPTVGRHNVINALGCAACALAAGIALPVIAAGLSTFTGAKGRLQKKVMGQLTVIDDTYNANPLSLRASADILADSAGYRIMVLGDMQELGDNELAIHHQLGQEISGKADAFLCVGEKMLAFTQANNKAAHYDDISKLQTALLALIRQHRPATVLVKGSRCMRMERIVDFLLRSE